MNEFKFGIIDSDNEVVRIEVQGHDTIKEVEVHYNKDGIMYAIYEVSDFDEWGDTQIKHFDDDDLRDAIIKFMI